MPRIAILGSGIAGLEAAIHLSKFGYEIDIIEKTYNVGGKLIDWHTLFPDYTNSISIIESQKHALVNKVNFLLGSEVMYAKKNVDYFTLQLSDGTQKNYEVVIIATGFNLFAAQRKEEYGYKIYDNVITSADLEKILHSDKPLVTTNNKLAQTIAFIHCVGSRDEKVGNRYCSKVCCITAVKQAIEIAKRNPDAEIYSFYMDLRMFDRQFEELYYQAQTQYNVHFIRGRLSEISEKSDSTLLLKAEDTLLGKPLRFTADVVVLMVGMEPSDSVLHLSKIFNIPLGDDRFFLTQNFHQNRNTSSQRGVYITGCATGPKSIGETLADARSVALEVFHYLNTKTKYEKIWFYDKNSPTRGSRFTSQ